MREKREREAIDEERSVPLRGLSFSRANSRGEAPSLFFFRPRPHLSPLSLSLSLSLSLLNSHKKTFHSVKLMFDHVNPKNGERAPLVADEIYQIVSEVRMMRN